MVLLPKYVLILKIVAGVVSALTSIFISIKVARAYRRRKANGLPTKRADRKALKSKGSKAEIKQWYRRAIEKIVTARLEGECSTTSGEPVFLSHYISQSRLRHWVLHVYGTKYELRQVSAEGSSTQKHYKATISTSRFDFQEYQRSITTHYSPEVGNYFYSVIGRTTLSKEEIDAKCDEVDKGFGPYARLTNNCHDFLQRLADEIVTKKAPDWEWFRHHDVAGYQYIDQPALGYDIISAATWSKYLTRSKHYLSTAERKKIDDFIAILEDHVDVALRRAVMALALNSMALNMNNLNFGGGGGA
ncbi:hypothetical protein N7540_002080 [Penicillium herquei]|nr:hypothetical protein N7540_002080 [Penicillium herquei]